MSSFQVHPKLIEDSYVLGDSTLSRVLLSRDARYPWLILIPRIENLRDLHELPTDASSTLWVEITSASTIVKVLIDADKVNVAALGNQVPQLHIHVIGRLTTDEAWPGPVWGVGKPNEYDDAQLQQRIQTIQNQMRLDR